MLKTTGMYSIVRHPLYLGNYIVVLGALLYTGVWWFCITVSLLFWLYYERIMFAEEEFLRDKFGSDYEQWAQYTPAVLPDFSRWRPPVLPFSFKFVISREYMSLYSALITFAFIGILYGQIHDFERSYTFDWVLFIAIFTFLYSLMRILKKKTRILKVPGR